MSCYYPNGNPSSGDIPCNSSGDGPCCPLNWSCESNGLCYLANAGYYGRYTCTDQTWDSPSCPQICTYDKTASGDEAILQCSSGSYCCDTNRPNPGCCDTSTSRFSLAALPIIAGGGTSIGTMSSAPSSTAAASSAPVSSVPAPFNAPVSSVPASFNLSPSTTSPTSPSASGNNAATHGSSTSSILVLTSVVTEGSGATTLITSTSPIAAAATASLSPSASSSTSKSLGTIIGPAVGVPVAVLALLALAFFLLWRRRRNRRAASPSTNLPTKADDLTPMYGAQETKAPMQTEPYAGKSELEGSPLVGHSPNPSTAPPSYRGADGQQRPLSELQGSPTVPTFRDSRGSELAAGSSPLTGVSASPREPQLPVLGEAEEGQQLPPELPGTTYRPYRPEGR